MEFFLGTHEPSWLGRTDVPLFVSRRRLARETPARPATCRWALDSGGFSEISMHGKWVTPAAVYAKEAERWMGLGGMAWAAIQDWMCEPWMLEKTGKTVEEHQRHTVESFLVLADLAPSVPWVPVLQGWAPADYLKHAEMYALAGVSLQAAPVVGVGSVCRRQSSKEGAALIQELSSLGLPLHGFGFKTIGLKAVGNLLASSDSMAWSYTARRGGRLDECSHKRCNNCLKFALHWRAEMLAGITPKETP